MAHTNDKYVEVMKLRSVGMKISEIVKTTGLTRSCINNWINRGSPKNEHMSNISDNIQRNPIDVLIEMSSIINEVELYSAYSFVLGMYLGDGCIQEINNSTQLTFSLDKKYERLNEYVMNVSNQVFGKNPSIYDRSVNRGQKSISNCINVKYCRKNLNLLFPQHGKGKKHTRTIELLEWQRLIINDMSLCQGLFFSDGSYYLDNVNNKWMYSFTNKSNGIINILSQALERLNIRYNIRDRKSSIVLTVKYQDDVRRLHEMIGDKNAIVNVLKMRE